MTTNPYGPARAQGSGITEIEDLRRRLSALERVFDSMIQTFTRELSRRLEDELASWGDVPERLARVEDLLAPMSVDPTTPEVEWSYRTPAPTDPTERLALITSGVPLIAKIHGGRDDGRMVVLPLPKMEPAGG
jgi:hypothetical protein